LKKKIGGVLITIAIIMLLGLAGNIDYENEVLNPGVPIGSPDYQTVNPPWVEVSLILLTLAFGITGLILRRKN